MTQYIYLLQTREFVNSKEPIYKIGKTTKLNFTRFNQYPQGSVLLFQSSCFDCNKLEREIIQLFKSKYKVRRSIGRESFEGNSHEMIKDFCDFIKNEKNVVGEEVVEEKIVEEKIVDEIVGDKVEEGVGDIVNDIVNDIVEETEKDSAVLINTITIREEQDIQKTKNDTNREIKHDNINGVDKTFCCLPCGYFCNYKCNLTKHKATKRHIDKIENPDVVEIGEYKCKNCVKTYKSHQGLWVHKKKCKARQTTSIVTTPEVYLHAKIDNLKKIMVEMGNYISKKHNEI